MGPGFTFIVFLDFVQYKVVLVPFPFFGEYLLLRSYLLVVHGGWTSIPLSSWTSCGTRLS